MQNPYGPCSVHIATSSITALSKALCLLLVPSLMRACMHDQLSLDTALQTWNSNKSFCIAPDTPSTMHTGTGESFQSFMSFLKTQLVASQIDAPLQLALESETIYIPSKAFIVPIVDIPGTADCDPVNAATLQQAVDDAIERSSQLLLCGDKTFETEGSLEPYVIPYFKYMLTTASNTAAVQGILMSGLQRHTPYSINTDLVKANDRQRVESSLAQIMRWLHTANSQLPEAERASSDRITALMARCDVKVVYSKLYTSLCLQSHEILQRLAFDAEVSGQELLTQTNGPWFLGENVLIANLQTLVKHVCASGAPLNCCTEHMQCAACSGICMRTLKSCCKPIL